ncbi:hypothetical protein LTR10_020646 [Elasticomyces elasticus]|uniref:Uncharacterized protein n=1 Tax=Exophiala sideris TaxID=1016849 RepID=A0ABR0J7J6_9EURO|nr:hypothetical protein LTR10_020646 [Elasticomyces elasticus]KAK5031563.1 hypothetical protein LTR13_007552 [Exophiala sideris]KAK5058240.1 hypothetical protein LTR69_006644 [Exophiala sideris]KAK5180170.1 hypothetical protein LTR44_007295 [Eurotiomycetes sp. CCFEE 6388]
MAPSWIQRVRSRFRRTQKPPDHLPRISIVRHGIVATYGFIDATPLPLDDRSRIIDPQTYLEQSREGLVNGGVRVEAPRTLRVPRRLRTQPAKPLIDEPDMSFEKDWERTMDRAIKKLEKVNEIVAKVAEDNVQLSKEMEEKLAVLTLSCCEVLATIGKRVNVDE